MELKVGDIVEKDGQQLEYLGGGKFKPVSILAKRFMDDNGAFLLHKPIKIDEIQ